MKFAVIGLGWFGRTLAVALAQEGADVIAVDHRKQEVDEVADHVAHAVRLDATDEDALRRQGVHEVDCAVVAIGDDLEANVLATVLLKGFGIKRVVTRTAGATQEKILKLLGAEVLTPELDSALRLASRLVRPGLLENLPLAEGVSFVQIAVPSHLAGRPLRELDLRGRFGCNIVAIRRAPAAGQSPDDPSLVNVPLPLDVLRPGDVIMLVGRDADLDRLTAGG